MQSKWCIILMILLLILKSNLELNSKVATVLTNRIFVRGTIRELFYEILKILLSCDPQIIKVQ